MLNRLILIPFILAFCSGCVSSLLNSDEIKVQRASGEETVEEEWKVKYLNAKGASPARYIVAVVEKQSSGKWQAVDIASVRNLDGLNLQPKIREAFVVNRAGKFISPLWDLGGLPVDEPYLCKIFGLNEQKQIDGVGPCNSEFTELAIIDSALGNTLSIATGLTASKAHNIDRDAVTQLLNDGLLEQLKTLEASCAEDERKLSAYSNKINIKANFNNLSGFEEAESETIVRIKAPKYFCGDALEDMTFDVAAIKSSETQYVFDVSGVPDEGIPYSESEEATEIPVNVTVSGKKYVGIKPNEAFENDDLKMTVTDLQPLGRYKAPLLLKTKFENKTADYLNIAGVNININGYQYAVIGRGQGSTLGPKQSRDITLQFENVDYAVLRQLQGVMTKSQMDSSRIRLDTKVTYVVGEQGKALSGSSNKTLLDML